MNKDLKNNNLTSQFLFDMLESLKLVDSYDGDETNSTLNRIVTFRNSYKFSVYYLLSESTSRLDYLTFEDDVQRKMVKKKRSWDEYNNEVSDLIDLFNDANRFNCTFRRLLNNYGNGRFEEDNPFTVPTIYFLELLSVLDFMLYNLVTNPEMYFGKLKV